jgi:hypothetical protein
MNGSCGTSALPMTAAATTSATMAIPMAKPAVPMRDAPTLEGWGA